MSIKKIIRIFFHPIKRHNENSKVSESFHDVEIIPMTLDTGTSNKVQKFKTCLRRQVSKVNWGTTIKIVGLIFIVGFFFILPSYASNIQTQGLVKVQSFLEKFLSLCSRGWIVLAILAGKLMTNDFVYGAFIHMDVYLRKIRNIMKNFANFALAGLVLYSIIKGLVGKEALDVKKVITKTLVAGILIQSSWFLMGALIDISTVATAGISAFPISFLKNDPTLKNKITSSINIFKSNRPIINFNATGTNWVHTIDKPLTNPQDGEELRENILPSYNSVSGPFIYLGMGVFNFQNYLTTKNSTEVVPLTLGFALRLFLLFLFTVGLLLLLIANIMRIGLLWVFIIGSPFLILAQVFDVGKGESSGLGGLFKISNLIAIAFKPVIFVAGISLMLIVIVSMQTSITGSGATRENDLNGVTLGMTGDGNTTSTLTVEGITNISVDQGDLLGKDVVNQGQNIFSHLIMLLLTIFLMRRFIKLSLITGGGPIEKTMERLTGLAENFAKSAPILPGGGSFTAASKAMEINKNKAFEGMGMNKAGEFGELQKGGFTTNEQKFNDLIGEKRFGESPSWKSQDYRELETIAKTGNSTNFFSKSKELAKARNGGLSMSNMEGRIKAFEQLSQKTGGEGFQGTLKLDATPEEITEYFTKGKGTNAKALYDKMGGYPASKAGTPENYEALKNITFFATKE